MIYANVFEEKTSEWEYPDRVLCKGMFLKRFLTGSKNGGGKKNVFKNFGDCTGHQVRTKVRPHYPNLGTGLGLKSMEAGAGRHNSRGEYSWWVSPDAGLRSKVRQQSIPLPWPRVLVCPG